MVLCVDHQEAPALGPSQRQGLADDIRAWAAAWNEDPKPFVWHKSADEILQRLAAYCSAINENHDATT